MRIAICDDEKSYLSSIKNICSDYLCERKLDSEIIYLLPESIFYLMCVK